MDVQQPAIDNDEPDSKLAQVPFGSSSVPKPGTSRHVAVASKGSGLAPCVLVVDDEAFIVEFLCLLLEEEGYCVLWASDGRQAWELARQTRPDLVISDVMMPGMTGLQLLDRLRESIDLAATPVILMSAVSREMESAGVSFVPKPFDIEQMLDLISVELMAAD